MIGALNVGERRLLALDRPLRPRRRSRDGRAALIDYSERRLRAEIDELPDGAYEAAMLVEDDGVTERPVRGAASTVVVRGDEVIADFTGSSPQVRGPMNCTYVVAASAVYNATFCVTDPQMLIPRNSGCYRPMRIIAPPARVVNVRHPGPSVGGNTDLQPKLIDLAAGARSRRPCPNGSRPASGGSSSQPALRRRASRDRPLLLELPLRRHGHGRDGAQGRQRRRDHASLELPQHAGRGVRAPLSAADARVPARARLRRRRASTAAASRRSGRCASPPTRSRSARSSTACEIAPPGLFGGRRRLGLRAARPARRRDDVPALRRGVRRRLADASSRTSSCGGGTSCATGRPGGGGFGDPPARDRGARRRGRRRGLRQPSRPRERDYGVEGGARMSWRRARASVARHEHRPLRGLRQADPAPGVDVRRRRRRAASCGPECEELYESYVRPTHGIVESRA